MIQIAGIKSGADLQALIDAQVEFVGFPLRLGYHQEDIPDYRAKELIQTIPPKAITPVLITYLNRANDILELARFIGVDFVQIHSDIERDELEKVKARENFRIIKSLVVREGNFEELKEKVRQLSELVDFFITDTFDSTTGAEGATGKTHDWEISRALVEISPKPLILAGGLKPTNVEQAILKVKPAGVDAHTGVEDSQGLKDPDLVKAFVSAARKGFSALSREEFVLKDL